MALSVDFTGYIAPDLTRPWVAAAIREAPSADGVFIEIDRLPYNIGGNYATDAATLPNGWFQVALIDADGGEQTFRPYPRWAPSLRDVAALCPEHTRVPVELGASASTFTPATNPTADEVYAFIEAAVRDVEARSREIVTLHEAHMANRAATWHAVASVHQKVPLDTDDADSSARRAEREYLGFLTGLGAVLAGSNGGTTNGSTIRVLPLRMA